MTSTTTTSQKYSVSLKEVGIGFLYAAGGAVLPLLQQALTATPPVFNWKIIAAAGLSAGLTYLGHKFFTPSQTITTQKP